MSFDSKIFYNEKIKKLQNLSVDEQIQLIKEYRQGSEEAKNILIENNIRYIVFAVKQKFGIDECDCEDLISTGIIGLIKGINTYNLEKGVKPITYFATCINNEILMYLRKNKKNRYISRSLDEQVFRDNYTFTLKDLLVDDTDFEEDFLNSQFQSRTFLLLKNMLEQIPEKHQEAVKLYFGFYGKRYKQKEIANKLGISQSYISRLVKKSGKLIKQMFKDIGIFSYNDLEYFDYSLLDQSIDSFNPSDKSNSEQTKCNDDIVSNPKCLSKKLIPKK